MNLKVKRLYKDAILPTYGSEGAACFDLYAYIPDFVGLRIEVLVPRHREVISTGLAFEVPEGWVMEIYPRSGHAARNGLTIVNSPGQIDSDYRGEVAIILLNTDNATDMWIRHGERIAQAKLVPAPRCTFEEVDTLTETNRGEGGFGSTGA
jgi:dUTP pyrophosphatase